MSEVSKAFLGGIQETADIVEKHLPLSSFRQMPLWQAGSAEVRRDLWLTGIDPRAARAILQLQHAHGMRPALRVFEAAAAEQLQLQQLAEAAGVNDVGYILLAQSRGIAAVHRQNGTVVWLGADGRRVHPDTEGVAELDLCSLSRAFTLRKANGTVEIRDFGTRDQAASQIEFTPPSPPLGIMHSATLRGGHRGTAVLLQLENGPFLWAGPETCRPVVLEDELEITHVGDVKGWLMCVLSNGRLADLVEPGDGAVHARSVEGREHVNYCCLVSGGGKVAATGPDAGGNWDFYSDTYTPFLSERASDIRGIYPVYTGFHVELRRGEFHELQTARCTEKPIRKSVLRTLTEARERAQAGPARPAEAGPAPAGRLRRLADAFSGGVRSLRSMGAARAAQARSAAGAVQTKEGLAWQHVRVAYAKYEEARRDHKATDTRLTQAGLAAAAPPDLELLKTQKLALDEARRTLDEAQQAYKLAVHGMHGAQAAAQEAAAQP